jgi:amino acid adenylation domain-containing protein
MTEDRYGLEGLDGRAKRELLALLLRKKAIESGEPFPLSLGQEALWFLHEFEPENPAYNVAFCARVRAEVDAKRLEMALLKVTERHPMLRCTFIGSGLELRQRVKTVPESCLEVVDASEWSEEELQVRVQQSFNRPFDLIAGPLFRATLFSRHDADHVLLIAVHHIIFDGFSFGYLLSELGALYEGNQSASLPPPGSYAEFVNWQRAMLESEGGREAWDYWRRRLQHCLSPADLPADYPRPSTRKMIGAAHHFELDAPLSARLRQFARAEKATPFMVLATAFHALLHRYTGAAEVPMGVPLAGRSRREFQNTIGYFVNPVIVCAPVEAATTFRQHLVAMREVTVKAQQYGDFPFIEIVKRLQPVRDTSRTPLFQVTLNVGKTTQLGVTPGQMLHDENGAPLQLGSLRLEAFPLRQQEGLFDLDVAFLDTGGIIPATIKYSTQLFASGTIARLAEHLLTLLSAAVAAPDEKISELPLLSDTERRQMLVEWNATEETYPEMTLHQLVEEQADRSPEAVAVVSESASITYRELDCRANKIAHSLQAMGIAPDAVVAVCLERSIDMVTAFLGILKSGAAYLPVDVSYPADRMAYILQDACVSAIIVAPSTAASVPGGPVPVIILGNESLNDQRVPRPQANPAPNNAAYVIYTSGSTGKPKGVVIEHRAIVNHVLWMQSRWPMGVGDAVLQCASPSFDASVWEVWNALAMGARLVIANNRGYADPGYLARCIIDHEVTHALIVPAVLELLAQHSDFERCTSLRCLFPGGEALKHSLVQLIRSRLDIEVVNLYGPTETTINATFWVTGESESRSESTSIEPIGRPIANDRAYILDSALNPVPIGVPGELHIGGASVGRGYLRLPELTAEKFIPDPFLPGRRVYKTGDICRFRADGVIEYLGRNDRQVKVRGFRIELGEIEAGLREHSSIRQAAVIAREHAPGDVRLTAFLVLAAGDNPADAELHRFLHDRLPYYMIPAAFVVVPSLPLTSSGKLDVKALPVPDTLRRSPQQEIVEENFASNTEAAVASIFKDVLGLDRVSSGDDFFELGGHSLLGTQLLARIRSTFGADVPVRQLFESRTVAGLAEVVEAQLALSARPEHATAPASIPRVSREKRRVSAEDVAAADARLDVVERR